jgi:hypothetical protein
VTGVSFYNEAMSGKRLQLLKEVVPGLARVGVLRNPLYAMHPIYWKDTEVAAQRLGVALEAIEVRGPRISKPHLRLPSNVTLRLSSPSMTPSHLLTGHGSPPWLPAADCRPCTAFVSSRMRGA